jgi:hypothetical protein
MKQKEIQELENSIRESETAWQLPERRVPQQAPPAIGIGIPHRRHAQSDHPSCQQGQRNPFKFLDHSAS